VPLPAEGFDLTECAVPWRVLDDAGHTVVFATPTGAPAAADPTVRSPVVLGQLGALPETVALYDHMVDQPAFRAPRAWASVDPDDFDALLVPGGHAPGVRQLLESETVQRVARRFFDKDQPVAAVCHGPVLLARTRSAAGASVLAGRTATCLPSWMEWSAYALTFWKMGRHYRTYPQTVQAEVSAALGADGRFARGPLSNDYGRPFVVEDGNLLTARWPGDSEALARALVARLAP
jgi:putative intracellular protease/amidase